MVSSVGANRLISRLLGSAPASRLGSTHGACGPGKKCGGEVAGVRPDGQIQDRVEISDAGLEASRVADKSRDLNAAQLSSEETGEVRELRKRDREVRAHEQAHKNAAGPHAKGGPSFEYTTGPDGRRYVTGGEVRIDTSPVPGNPDATIRKMQQIR